VQYAKKTICRTQIVELLTIIRAKLLDFLLELNEEIGENENTDIVENDKIVDSLFEKTIGSISAETVIISMGNDNPQTVSMGDNAKLNVAKGESVTQNITVEIKNELAKFIEELKPQLDKLGLSLDDKEDVRNEILRIETQLRRQEPKYQIVNTAIRVIHDILIGVTGNAISPAIIEQLGRFIG
jgi:hypothetical protein